MLRPYLQISIPEAFRGNPLRLPGVDARFDPFNGLSGPKRFRESAYGSLGADLQRTIGDVAAITVVTPGPVSTIARAVSLALDSLIIPRVGVQGRFYVTQPEGDILLQSNPAFFRQTRCLEMMGSFGQDITAGLDRLRFHTAGLHEIHANLFPQLVDLAPGEVLIETGAGSDYTRIKALHQHATQKGAILICHDITPASARAADKNIPGIRFVFLPPQSQFLTSTFLGVSGQKALSLKDVLSTIPRGGHHQLLHTAKTLGVDRILVTQSVAIADNTNLFLSGVGPDSEFFSNILSQNLPGIFQSKNILRDDRTNILLGSAAILQAKETYRQITMHLALSTFLGSAREDYGYKSQRPFSVRCIRDLKGPSINECLGSISNLEVELFRTGIFNTLYVGNGGGYISFDKGVTQGTLRVVHDQVHLEVARTKRSNIIQSNSTGEHNAVVSVAQLSLDNPFSTKEARFLSPREMLGRLLGLPDSLTSQTVNLNLTSGSHMKEAQKIGAKLVCDFMVDFLGQRYGLPIIVDSGNPELLRSALYRHFVDL